MTREPLAKRDAPRVVLVRDVVLEHDGHRRQESPALNVDHRGPSLADFFIPTSLPTVLVRSVTAASTGRDLRRGSASGDVAKDVRDGRGDLRRERVGRERRAGATVQMGRERRAVQRSVAPRDGRPDHAGQHVTASGRRQRRRPRSNDAD